MAILLKKDLRVKPEDEKTNISLPFTVPCQVKSLEIEFSYEPKILEDNDRARLLIEKCIEKDAGEFKAEYPTWESFLPLKNLITVSLDDPEGHRGCAHRQANFQSHSIGESFASPGFYKGKIQQGRWQVVLNIHGVVTEEIACRLCVKAGEGDE